MSHVPHDAAFHAIAAALAPAAGFDAVRLVPMVYLADWRAAITLHRTITGAPWTFASGEPEAPWTHQTVRDLPCVLRGSDVGHGHLSAPHVAVVRHVVLAARDLPRWELLRLARSTWPAMRRLETPDLVAAAREYIAANPDHPSLRDVA